MAQRIAMRVIVLERFGNLDAIRDLWRLVIASLYRALGAGVAIGIMESLARLGHQEAVRVPFVTSIVLTLFASESAQAKPYAVVTGHLVSSIAGLAALVCLGTGDAAAALGVGAAGLLMIASRALHPPAGVDAFLIAHLGLPWWWIVNPVLIGAVLLAGFSRLWAAGGCYLSAKQCR
jgi:CBS-domain-containing membrane protein